MSCNDIKDPNKLNKIGDKNQLNNIKSKFILKLIIDYVIQKISLGLIKYNKNIQQKLNLNIKDFEEGSKFYSSIEIELKIAKNKYGEFINILKEEEKHYYHIFFNDDKKEIKRRYIKENENIEKVKININFEPISFEKLFNACECIEYINFKKFYRITITNMDYMFSGCSSLKKIYLSNFITDNVTSMDSMFSGCSSLRRLNLSKFNTKKVTRMTFMFSDCSTLEELNLSSFNTDSIEDLAYMFSGCISLEKLNITHFNTNASTNNKINMEYLFNGCPNGLKWRIQEKYKFFKKEAFLDGGLYQEFNYI